MKRFLLVLLGLSAVALGCGGCSHIPFIGRKKLGNEPSKRIATDTEREFEGRWVDKRAGELVQQGQAPDAAHAQAVQEFMKTFPATTIAREP